MAGRGGWRGWRARRAARRELARLAALPRRAAAVTPLLGPPFGLVDGASFVWTYRDLFERELYAFRAATERPYIVDAGANIGLSVLYFKRLYPESEVVAFEPDPDIFAVLEANVRAHELRGVTLIQRAVWSSDTLLAFAPDGADGGRVGVPGPDTGRVVPAAALAPYLERRVDLLKLDVEGAETEVLRGCRERLANVERVYVEYHSSADAPQTLHCVLEILGSAGMRVQILPCEVARRPFLDPRPTAGFDLQVHVFGYRR
ncbi:MAG TPA: FkbM family methyltransferase [Gemmatimonadales bacterium]|nr:FkbM family methyltransferase [Gemmatimonadales bacterium]